MKALLHSVMVTGFFLFFTTITFSQSRKEIKKLGILSVTESVTYNASGKETTYVESVEKFDKDGNVVEETVFNKDSSIKKKEIRKYNKSGKILEEIKFAEKGIIVSKNIMTYNDNDDKTSEQLIDGTGKIIEWYKYGYNSLYEKTYEHQLDDKGKLIKKSIYSYDKNGLKKDKKTYNSSDELISVKKFVYKTVQADE